MQNLPSGLKKIIFNKYFEDDSDNEYSSDGSENDYYTNELNLLPNSLEYLVLPANYKNSILNHAPNLCTIVCSKNYIYRAELKKKFNFEIFYF